MKLTLTLFLSLFMLTTAGYTQNPANPKPKIAEPRPDVKSPPVPFTAPTLTREESLELQLIITQQHLLQVQADAANEKLQAQQGAFISRVEAKYPGFTISPQGTLVKKEVQNPPVTKGK